MSIETQRERVLERHIGRLGRKITIVEAKDTQLSTLRLFVALVGAVLVFGVWQGSGARAGLLLTLLITGVFAWIWREHQQVRRSLAALRGQRQLWREQLGRLQLDWDALPPPLLVAAEERTPLEVDFDLVGPRSLHRLLNTTASAEAAQRLRARLGAGRIERAAMLTRQALVRELRPLQRWRDGLTRAARQGNENISQAMATLHTWLDSSADANEQALERRLKRSLPALFLLAFLNIGLFLLAATGRVGAWWQVTFVAYVVLSLLNLGAARTTFETAAAVRDAMERLLDVFGRIETFSYADKPQLRALCASFLEPQARPSRLLRSVVWVVGATGLRGNPIVWALVNAALPWDLFFAWRLQQLRGQLGERLPTWLDAWIELDVMAALANFSWLFPSYQLPTVSDDGDTPFLQAQQLGHPLLGRAERVCNDVTIAQRGELQLITGSNMAGKSTYLRTLGVNAVLASVGTVVCAERLALRPMQLFSCIKVTDSVSDGFSYFYAEVRRLKLLLDTLVAGDSAEALPLLYFIDEIFRGTNNRERLIGSRALIRAFAQQRGVGLISTHDLELVKLADEFTSIYNYHFREDVVDGRMVFDFKLRHGPCPTTNALRIMQLEGLPIES